MKKYTFASPVASAAAVATLKRTMSGSNRGFSVNGFHITVAAWSGRDLGKFKDSYNGILSRNKQVDIVPESNQTNTVITTDGLVAVVYSISGINYISVVDLFDTGIIANESITPEDYQALLSFLLSTNPEHKRIFAAYKAGPSENFRTRNTAIYRDSGHVYFSSDMDTGLETDEYGNHKSPEADFSEETESFTFLKKQFFLVKGPEDIVATADGYQLIYDEFGSKVYWSRNPGISGEDDLVSFSFLSASSDRATIIVY
jgi:hypothetical protein